MLQDSEGNLFKTVLEEFFLTADSTDGLMDYGKYVRDVRSNLAFHVIKLYTLNEDETPLQDVSESVLSGNLSYNYQQGLTHSLNLTVVNSDGFWSAEPINKNYNNKTFVEDESNHGQFIVNERLYGARNVLSVRGNIWNGAKFRLDIGLYVGGSVYWRKCGIFVLKDASFQGGATQTVSLQLYDKFALFDGKITGKMDSDFKIPLGTNLQEAINMCVHYSDEANGVKVFDTKPVIYESDLSEIKTPYTITKSAETTIGDIIIELADIASQDVYYNENGNLTLRPGNDAFSHDKRGVQWYYTEYDNLDYADPTYSIDYGAIINKFTVKGGIANGYQFKGVAINDNPLSKSNVYLNQVNAEILEDDNIMADDLALERAKYELNKRIISYTKNSYKSIFIPHLMPRDEVQWTCPEFNIYNEKYIIQSLSIQLGSGFFMSLEMANVKEVAA